MLELGELERRHDDFAQRNTRVVVVSLEDTAAAQKTQIDFPHLLVLADKGRGLAEAGGFIHPHAAPDGGDANVPTTILIDRHGTVRWLYRPSSAMIRLSPDEVLQAVDEHLGHTR